MGVECYGLCLNVPPEPHADVGVGHFRGDWIPSMWSWDQGYMITGSRVCNTGIDLKYNARYVGILI